jgi:acetolactate synthase-1/2/3 large subunit
MRADDMMHSRTGGQILVDQLRVQGVDTVFCVPGESYLAVLDALYGGEIKVTVCRQEGGAAMMAEAYGKLSGRPGICFVTRGPGATNASAGVHVARQDSTPMVLFIGQVERGFRGREAFQELDYRAVFGSMAKWVTEVDAAERLPEIVSRAFSVATSGRPGPVVIALPEDMLTERVTVADARPIATVETSPGALEMQQLERELRRAKRPIAIVGGSRWSAAAVEEFTACADRFDLPVTCSFRRQMLFPADHRCHAGDLGVGANPKLVERIAAADLVIAIGGRLSELPSQSYSLFAIPNPRQRFVHVHPDPDELGRIYQADLAINASPVAFVRALSSLTWERQPGEHTAKAHEDYERWSDPTPIDNPGELQLGAVLAHLRRKMPPETVFCNGAGNFAIWLHRFWPFRRYGGQVASTSGSMGYGVPAGVAAKQFAPERPVIVFSGDGDFLMGQEFATAVQYGLPIVVVLLDNGMFGTIRMHQEIHYPGRPCGTGLKNPDFRALAQAYGGHGEWVTRTDEFPGALERALASGKPAIIHCRLDPEAITPTATLAGLRAKALAAS